MSAVTEKGRDILMKIPVNTKLILAGIILIVAGILLLAGCPVTPPPSTPAGPTGPMRDVDADDDGLMEIRNLDMLNNMRYNPEGTNYRTGASDPGSSFGAPAMLPPNCAGRSTATNLCGYELTQDLDFAIAAHYAAGSGKQELEACNRGRHYTHGRR